MNKKLLVILGIVAVVISAVTVLVTANRENPPSAAASPTPSASPTPTANSLTAADRELLTRLSTELAAKYRSFSRVDQSYLDSIQPYLTKQFFDEYRSTLRYADRAPFLQPVKSEALDTTVTGDSAKGTAAGVVRLSSTDLKTRKKFDQTLRIDWKRFGQRWSATKINALEFNKE